MDSSSFWKYIKLVILLLIVLFGIVYFYRPDQYLHVISCNVGQGDATLIVWQNNQILIDGGPDNSVLNCLGRHIPFYDRTIELVILTHPDADHSFGLIEVSRRYKIDLLLKNNISTDTQGYRLLEKEIGSQGIKTVEPYIGQKLRLGLIYLDIFWPNGAKLVDTNDYSIVTELSFGNFKAILTGDLEEDTANNLKAASGLGTVDYIKASHHGSKNGVTNYLLDVLRPKVAVISAGKNNRYGHPSPETLELYKKYNIKFYGTYDFGDIEIISDGKSYWIKE